MAEAQINVTANDQASGPIKNVADNLRNLKQETAQAGGSADSLASSLGGVTAGLAQGAVAAKALGVGIAGAALAAGKMTFALGRLGVVLGGAGIAFGLVKSLGEAVKLSNELQEMKWNLGDKAERDFQPYLDGITDSMVRLGMAREGLIRGATKAADLGMNPQEGVDFAETTAMWARLAGESADQAAEKLARAHQIYEGTATGYREIADGAIYMEQATHISEKAILDFVLAQGVLPRQLGVSSRFVTAFGGTMMNAGASAGEATRSLRALLDRLGAPGAMTKQSRKAFADLGIDAKKFSAAVKKDPDKAIVGFLSHLNKFKDKGKLLEKLQLIFGRQVADEIRRASEKAEELKTNIEGVANSTHKLRDKNDFMNKTVAGQIDRATNMWNGMWTKLGARGVPELEYIVSRFSGALDSFAAKDGGFDLLVSGIKTAIEWADSLLEKIASITEAIVGMGQSASDAGTILGYTKDRATGKGFASEAEEITTKQAVLAAQKRLEAKGLLPFGGVVSEQEIAGMIARRAQRKAIQDSGRVPVGTSGVGGYNLRGGLSILGGVPGFTKPGGLPGKMPPVGSFGKPGYAADTPGLRDTSSGLGGTLAPDAATMFGRVLPGIQGVIGTIKAQLGEGGAAAGSRVMSEYAGAIQAGGGGAVAAAQGVAAQVSSALSNVSPAVPTARPPAASAAPSVSQKQTFNFHGVKDGDDAARRVAAALDRSNRNLSDSLYGGAVDVA